MNTQQEIAQALRDLEPEEAMTIVTNWLNEHDVVHTLWVAEDIDTVLEERGVPVEDRADIIDKAQDTYWWRALGDCTDTDWANVDMAIDEAIG